MCLGPASSQTTLMCLTLLRFLSFLPFVSLGNGPIVLQIASFQHRSMGPLKDLLQKTLKKIGKTAFFSSPFLNLFERYSSELDNAIRDFNDHKHKKIASEKVQCHEYLRFFADGRSRAYRGTCRIAADWLPRPDFISFIG